MTQLYIPKYLEASYDNGFTCKDESNNLYQLYSQEIGNLEISEGDIIACDPFIPNCDVPFTAKFPIGSFPVQLAIAQIDDDERIAFSRIKFSDEIPCSWTLAVGEGQDPSKLGANEIYGYGVDTGTGAFMDVSAARELMNFMEENEENFEILSNGMDQNYKNTRGWSIWKGNNTNVAMFSSGWGDGHYATYIGYDKHGNVCRLVTDFVVIG